MIRASVARAASGKAAGVCGMGSELPRLAADRLVHSGASTTGRVLAWAALAAASGLLVRAEVRRPEQPPNVSAFTDLTYRESGLRRLRLDVYVPSGAAPQRGRPAVVAVHGGGWRGGSRSEYGRSMAENLAPYGIAVVSVDYRLSRPGAATWPGNLDDVREAVRWVRSHARDYEIDPNRIALIGSSAGAHLALMLACDSASASPSDPSTRISAIVDLYGPTDLLELRTTREITGEPVTMMLGGTPTEVPDRYTAASPLHHVSRGMPPSVLILHGDEDWLVPREQSRSLDAKLADARVTHKLRVVRAASGMGSEPAVGRGSALTGHRPRARDRRLSRKRLELQRTRPVVAGSRRGPESMTAWRAVSSGTCEKPLAKCRACQRRLCRRGASLDPPTNSAAFASSDATKSLTHRRSSRWHAKCSKLSAAHSCGRIRLFRAEPVLTFRPLLSRCCFIRESFREARGMSLAAFPNWVCRNDLRQNFTTPAARCAGVALARSEPDFTHYMLAIHEESWKD